MRTTSIILVGCLVLGLSSQVGNAADCDVAILNGRVMDPETKFDAVRNVCVSNGWIVGITEDRLSGKETINAKGHVVAPGFIDTEQHGDPALETPSSL
jgi:N-acyl-D-amino-acid deacylase